MDHDAATAPSVLLGQTAFPTLGERWLLGMLRRWAGLRRADERPQAIMSGAFADRVPARVCAQFAAWIQAVEAELTRSLRVQHPGCAGISDDEQRLILACGLAPIAPDLGHALLRTMVGETGLVMGLGRILNSSLSGAGLSLPARMLDTPLRTPAPTLH